MSSTPLTQKSALVINTASRRGRRLFKTAQELLTEAGIKVVSYPVDNPKDLRPTVKKLVQEGYELIIVGGGDGTISTVVNELAYSKTVLGLLPLGTANSFARSLDISTNLTEAVEVIAKGRVVDIDLGKINEEYFANVASIGFATQVAEQIPHLSKRYLGALAYLLETGRQLVALRRFNVSFKGQETSDPFWTYQIVIANGGYYGPASMAAKTRLQSADLVAFTFKQLTPFQLIMLWLRSATGTKMTQQGIDYIAVDMELVLKTTPVKEVSIDGEIKTKTPIHISVAALALKILVPQESPLKTKHVIKSLLTPDARHKKISEVDFASLSPRNHLILDIDNTLVTRHGTVVAEETVNQLKELRAKGIIKDICLVSNVILPGRRRLRRVAEIAKQLDAHHVGAFGWHAKPHRRPFEQAMSLMKSNPENTVVVGDQIYTDIKGGNLLGLYTILVEPIGNDAWFTKYRRWLERRQ